MRRIVLPQAMRVIVPPTGNEFISMLKTTSLAEAITYGELLRRASDIYSSNLNVVPLLVVASIWYLVLTTVAGTGQYFLERRFARGLTRERDETVWERVRRAVGGRPRL
jgi:polar amino acid transport system permease protein